MHPRDFSDRSQDLECIRLKACSLSPTSDQAGLNHIIEIRSGLGIAIWVWILPPLSTPGRSKESPGQWVWVTETSDPLPAQGAQSGQP